MTNARWLHELPAYRVLELPRRSLGPGDADSDGDGRRQRAAALAAIYHGGADAVGIIWSRRSPRHPVDLLALGEVAGSRAPGGDLILLLPTGARAVALPAGNLPDAVRLLPEWNRVTAVADALLVHDDEGPSRQRQLSLPEQVLEIWREPFAWMVAATRVNPEEVARLAGQAASEAREAAERAHGSPDHAVQATRSKGRLAELRRAATSGLWQVHLLAGGGTALAARAIGGVLAASADLSGLQYSLVPTGETGSLDDLLRGGPAPFFASSALLAALLEPPRRELPGVLLRMPPDFDTTPEAPPGVMSDGKDRTVPLGHVLDNQGQPMEPLPVPIASLVRHVFVAGATGAGKSQTVRHLLEGASSIGIPWLIIEPSKAEYRLMAARSTGSPVVVIRPGDIDAAPAGVNPLEPAPGFALQTHVDLVRALFVAAFDAEEPFPQVLTAALARCYTEQGWQLALGRPRPDFRRPRYPTLADLERSAESVVDEVGYGREVADNVRGFIRVRLGSLRLGTTGRFFEGGHPLDFAQVMRGQVVFELETIGDDQDKAFLMGTLLIRLIEHLRVDARRSVPHAGGELRHLTVIEEAHRLLRSQAASGASAHAVELFASLLAEIRAYGEGIVIAEQIPTKLAPDVLKNTAVKILHRLPARDDRDVVGATMNLTEAQSAYVVSLRPGTAAVFTDGMDFPVLTTMPDGTDRETAPATPAGPIAMIGRRSETCGADCLRRPCTLTEIETARQLPENPATSWLVLWAELCTVAHLTGWAAPRPVADRLLEAAELPARQRDCAFGHLADSAVNARSAAVARVAAPAVLAEHVAETMRGLVAGAPPCPPAEPQWLATPFRWCLIWDELTRLVRNKPDAARHPRSGEWEQRHGRRLPGLDAAAQLAVVDQWYRADEQKAADREMVFFGSGKMSTVERMVGEQAGSQWWEAGLDQALADFSDVGWARRYLAHRDRRSA